MSLLIGPLLEAEWVFAIGRARDHGFSAAICKPVTQLCAIVSLVPEQLFRRLGSADQTFRDRAIVRLATGHEDGKKTAFSICECVDLRIAPAA